MRTTKEWRAHYWVPSPNPLIPGPVEPPESPVVAGTRAEAEREARRRGRYIGIEHVEKREEDANA